MLAHMDVFAIVAVERLYDEDIVIAYLTQQVFQKGQPLLGLMGPQVIVVAYDLAGGVEFGKQFGVGG